MPGECTADMSVECTAEAAAAMGSAASSLCSVAARIRSVQLTPELSEQSDGDILHRSPLIFPSARPHFCLQMGKANQGYVGILSADETLGFESEFIFQVMTHSVCVLHSFADGQSKPGHSRHPQGRQGIIRGSVPVQRQVEARRQEGY